MCYFVVRITIMLQGTKGEQGPKGNRGRTGKEGKAGEPGWKGRFNMIFFTRKY